MRTVALFATALIAYSAAEHSYTQGDLLPLYANKVGPFANPSETYEYYTLPFCKPAEDERKGLDLGEAIGGDRLVKTTFKIQFNSEPRCSFRKHRESVLRGLIVCVA